MSEIPADDHDGRVRPSDEPAPDARSAAAAERAGASDAPALAPAAR